MTIAGNEIQVRDSLLERYGWLGYLGVVGVVALMFQLFPTTWVQLLHMLDCRTWSRLTWICANIILITVLITRQQSGNWHDALTGRFATTLGVALLAFLSLLLINRSFPTAWPGFLSLINAQNWPRSSWTVLNIIVLLSVFAYRYRVQWVSAIKSRRTERIAKKQRDREIKQRIEQRLHAVELKRRGEKGIDFY